MNPNDTARRRGFGELLRTLRKRTINPETGRELSQEKIGTLLAQALNQGKDQILFDYDARSISNWETGIYRPTKRLVVMELIMVLKKFGGIDTVEEVDKLLYLASYEPLTLEEMAEIFPEVTPPPPPHLPPLHLFMNIWYSSHRMHFLEVYNPIVGVLKVFPDHLVYESEQKFEHGMLVTEPQGKIPLYRLVILRAESRQVLHSQHQGNVNNNWVRIEYGDQQLEAWFAEASKWMGIGNLIGGSHQLYDALAQWHSAKA